MGWEMPWMPKPRCWSLFGRFERLLEAPQHCQPGGSGCLTEPQPCPFPAQCQPVAGTGKNQSKWQLLNFTFPGIINNNNSAPPRLTEEQEEGRKSHFFCKLVIIWENLRVSFRLHVKKECGNATSERWH